MKKLLLCVSVILSGVVGCAAQVDPVGSDQEAIVGGMLATDEPAVVAIWDRSSGGMCSGTLIAPRVVLTAKHCVWHPGATGTATPTSFFVVTGNYATRPEESYTVVAADAVPGVWYEDARGSATGSLIGLDVGLLTLSRPMSGVTPREFRRTAPTDQIGELATVVGFGERPAGMAGIKYKTTARIQAIQGTVIYTGPSICSGDSGGPFYQADGKIIGVTSFGTGDCGDSDVTNGFQAIFGQLELIDRVVSDSGACIADPPERCDAVDNDCDGDVDEDCAPIGTACESGDECMGGDCRDDVCTMDCDPLRPTVGCPSGFYCRLSEGCTGACVAGTVPESGKGVGESCENDVECDTLFCRDPGDGNRRCLQACRGDDGMCMRGEVCAAYAGECNACVASSLVSINDLRRGLGESCGANEECASSMCYEDNDIDYCSRTCESDSGCARGYHCRNGTCAVGRREGTGSLCVVNEDCQNGMVCAQQGDRAWCASFCGDGMSECPENFTCTAVGSVSICAPAGGLLGDRCDNNESCISGLCSDLEGDSVCTRVCGSDQPCGAGFVCARQQDGSGLCASSTTTAPPVTDDDSGGCSISSSESAFTGFGDLSTTMIGLVLGLGYARRRASHRAPHPARRN